MPRPWNLVDFVLVVLGGLLGLGVAVVLGLLVDNTELALILALAGQYAGHLLVIWLLGRGREDRDLGLSVEPGDLIYLPLGLLLQIVLAVLFLPLANLLLPDGGSAQQIGDTISALTTTAGKLAAVAVAVVLAPVTEELIFRGVLIKALSGLRRMWVIVISSLVWSAFHLLGLDPATFWASAAIVIPELFILGVVLALITFRSGRLGPAIFVHSGFNLLAALVLLIPSELLDQLA